MFDIHPNAKENFDSKSRSFISMVYEQKNNFKKSDLIESDLYYHSFNDMDLLDCTEHDCDYRGNVIARYFYYNSKKYGLSDEAYSNLIKLAASIQKIHCFNEKLSLGFVEFELFCWVSKNFKGEEVEHSFIDYLVHKTCQFVKNIIINVPIANTMVEEEFYFCGGRIKNLAKATIDEFQAKADKKEGLENFIVDFRKKYQGYSVIEFSLQCEKDFAREYAIRKANDITALLGIYSRAVLIPDVKCLSRIRGSNEYNQTQTTFILGEGTLSVENSVVDTASNIIRKITKEDLSNYASCGMNELSKIIQKKSLSKYEELVLNTAFLYSKVAFTSDPLEKLVYALSALESTLLKSNEPIQQNVGERLAFFISKESIKRKEIVQNLRDVYDIRSNYIHHGKRKEDFDKLQSFFINVWIFFCGLVCSHEDFIDKEALLNELDDRKFSG